MGLGCAIIGFHPSAQAPVKIGIIRSTASLAQTRTSVLVSRKRAALTVVAAAEAAGSASEDPLERYAMPVSGDQCSHAPTTQHAVQNRRSRRCQHHRHPRLHRHVV